MHVAAPSCFSVLLVASAVRCATLSLFFLDHEQIFPTDLNLRVIVFHPLPLAQFEPPRGRSSTTHKAKETRRGSRELRESVLLARSACDAANRVAVRRLARLWGWPRARTWCLSFAHEHWIPHLCVCVQHAVSNCLRGTVCHSYDAPPTPRLGERVPWHDAASWRFSRSGGACYTNSWHGGGASWPTDRSQWQAPWRKLPSARRSPGTPARM